MLKYQNYINIKRKNYNWECKLCKENTHKIKQKYALNHDKNVKCSLNNVSLSIEPFFDLKMKSTNLFERGKLNKRKTFLSAEILHFKISFNFFGENFLILLDQN